MATVLSHPDNDPRFAQEEPESAPLVDFELEATIIATVVRYPDSIRHLMDVHSWHFAGTESEAIWKAIMDKIAAGESWTPMSLNLATNAKFSAYTAHCIAGTTSINPKNEGSLLIELAQRRRLLAAAKQQIAAVQAGKNSGEIAAIGKKAAETTFTTSTLITGKDAALQLVEDMSRQVEPRSTGIDALDQAMEGGMYPGEMYVLGGRKKTGKTMFGGTLSFNLSEQGCKHLYIAAEMGAKRIQQRLMARHLKIAQKNYRYGADDYSQTMSETAYHASRMKDSVLYYNAPGVTIEQIKQVVAMAVMKHGIEGFIVDYWQIIGGRGKMDERAHLDHVAQEIANIAEQFNIWNWTLSQVNQDGNSRGGEGIRNACTMYMELHRPDKTQPWMWMEMKETRNTDWTDIGSKSTPALMIDTCGPYIREIDQNDNEPIPAHYSATKVLDRDHPSHNDGI